MKPLYILSACLAGIIARPAWVSESGLQPSSNFLSKRNVSSAACEKTVVLDFSDMPTLDPNPKKLALVPNGYGEIEWHNFRVYNKNSTRTTPIMNAEDSTFVLFRGADFTKPIWPPEREEYDTHFIRAQTQRSMALRSITFVCRSMGVSGRPFSHEHPIPWDYPKNGHWDDDEEHPPAHPKHPEWIVYDQLQMTTRHCEVGVRARTPQWKQPFKVCVYSESEFKDATLHPVPLATCEFDQTKGWNDVKQVWFDWERACELGQCEFAMTRIEYTLHENC